MNLIEELLQIDVHHPLVAFFQIPCCFSYGRMTALPFLKAMAARMERRLVMRLHHQMHRLLHHPIDHVRDAQAPLPASCLRYPHSPDCSGLIGLFKQFADQHRQDVVEMSCHLFHTLPSGPGAPSLDFTCSNASLSLPSFATSSIVIAGATPLFLPLGFGTALLLELGWPASVTSASPFGLSAVPKFIRSCRVCSLAVTAFPPCLLAVKTVFRRLSGTTRSSDFSRPFVISFLVLDDYRRAFLCSRRPRDLPG